MSEEEIEELLNHDEKIKESLLNFIKLNFVKIKRIFAKEYRMIWNIKELIKYTQFLFKRNLYYLFYFFENLLEKHFIIIESLSKYNSNNNNIFLILFIIYFLYFC